MNDHILSLLKDPKSKGVLYVAPSLFKKWIDSKRFPNKIGFGAKQASCQLAPHPDNKEELLLSEDVWTKLGIPFSQPVHTLHWNDTFTLSPLIGVFTAGFQSSLTKPLGFRTTYFAELLSKAPSIGVYAFVFGAHHIRWETKTIEGLFYQNGQWTQCSVPFPSAIYDRIPSRKIASLPKQQEAKNYLSHSYMIPWYNESFFDKGSLYQHLMNISSTRAFLPESIQNPTKQEIERMLEQYTHVYCKPANGSLGSGIQQIIKSVEDAYYYCRFYENGQNRLRRYTNLRRLLTNQFPNKFEHFIVQQGIHLFQFEGKPVDFRVHTNKNEKGRWLVTALAAKVAGNGSVTTHVKAGGEVKSIAEVFPLLPGGMLTIDMLKSTALHLSEVIESLFNGFIGEIGFDFGIDKQGEIWLLEANSRPGRTIFHHPELSLENTETLRLPLLYGAYLTSKQGSAFRQPLPKRF
ncbi:YheC/YheD family endospore coat-associated protein [Halalkalibacterium ligniniphilum]|uniref:YheC/YheD family endospore coat-associated protein n=1 Tax=Halalkalibacterium ligniniphilum TaxID=1134413 RepID=UPI000346D0CF|nr:YheC/YheD family protein [Halalkalibacterium ligniniphilum]